MAQAVAGSALAQTIKVGSGYEVLPLHISFIWNVRSCDCQHYGVPFVSKRFPP